MVFHFFFFFFFGEFILLECIFFKKKIKYNKKKRRTLGDYTTAVGGRGGCGGGLFPRGCECEMTFVSPPSTHMGGMGGVV